MTKVLTFHINVKYVCVCNSFEKMRRLFFVLITPILCFSSLVLMFHEYFPSVLRRCIRTTVVSMRKNIRYESIQGSSTKEKKRTSYLFFFSVFEKRRFAIIRLIRLVSGGGSPLFLRNKLSIAYRKGVCVYSCLLSRHPFRCLGDLKDVSEIQ